ncbi:odorant receptor 30a-like [Anoplophora glabripennis]|uniref:odorant receptor 30a-like n=1 Tax=Anoplophora glabripennis TaxID=217634 RepID=UPI000C7629BF|nr:odorant receptor 30a-like [Anoplophora glabripennis]
MIETGTGCKEARIVEWIPEQTMQQNYDFSSYFRPSIIILKILGFWRPERNMKFKGIYNCYTALCSLIWVQFLLSQIIYIINNRNDVQEVTAVLSVTVTFTINLIQMMFFYKNTNYLKILIKEMNRPLFQVKCQKHYHIAKNTERMYKLMFKSCLYLAILTDALVTVVPLMGKEKKSSIKGWFPYDYTKPLYFILTYIFQKLVFIWNTFICLNTAMTIIGLLTQFGLQCDLLCCTLDSLDDFYTEGNVLYEISLEDKLKLTKDRERFSIEMTKNLVICVEHHRQIIRVVKDVERISGTGLFILFVGGGLILCSSLFPLSVSSLILQSAFNTPWIGCNVKFQKIMLLYMMKTSKPMSILTGGLFTMSVPVFVSTLRTAYSYFTLLQNIQ